MKTIKIVLLMTTISFFTSVPFLSAKADHCVGKEGMQKLLCSLDPKVDYDGSSSSESKKEKKGSAGNWFKKLKQLGGENIGEEG